jgi:hypothetical protein
VSERHLISLRRRIGADQHAAYDAAWHHLRDAAVARGAHAWRFRSAADATEFLEFLEFRAGADPRSHTPVRDALAALDRLAPASPEEWREADREEAHGEEGRGKREE